MHPKDINHIIEANPALFTEALTSCSHRMDNYYFYRFRTLDLTLNTDSPHDGMVPGITRPRPSESDHVGRRLVTASKVAYENRKKLDVKISDMYEDVTLYSSVDDNDIISNGAKTISFVGQAVRNHDQKGSRIELVSSRELEDKRLALIDEFQHSEIPREVDEAHKLAYLVYSYDHDIYHLNGNTENLKHVFDRFNELLEREGKAKVDARQLSVRNFEELAIRHCERLHIQHGWIHHKRLQNMEPPEFVRSLIIGKKAKQSLSILALLGLLSFITPIISVVVNILATEGAIYMIYKEHKYEAYRKTHLGRNPPPEEQAKIQAEARYFAMQAIPCSLYIGFSMLKDMGAAGIMLRPIEHIVHDFCKSLFRALSIEFNPGMLLLSGFAMAITITALAAASIPENRKQKGAIPLIFVMSFMAGMIFASASLITSSNHYLEASMMRTAEEIVSAVTTLMLFIGIYHAPEIAQKISHTENTLRLSAVPLLRQSHSVSNDNSAVPALMTAN